MKRISFDFATGYSLRKYAPNSPRVISLGKGWPSHVALINRKVAGRIDKGSGALSFRFIHSAPLLRLSQDSDSKSIQKLCFELSYDSFKLLSLYAKNIPAGLAVGWNYTSHVNATLEDLERDNKFPFEPEGPNVYIGLRVCLLRQNEEIIV